jgi:hypothetical protein
LVVRSSARRRAPRVTRPSPVFQWTI